MSVAAEICYIHSPNATARVADFSALGRIYALQLWYWQRGLPLLERLSHSTPAQKTKI